MATGEGKTLVATLAVYIVALSGRKVHVVTTNDFLAKRDRDWMAPVYEGLGISIGAIQSEMDTAGDERRYQYDCDITHGTNNEFGFDYLRDNMKVRFEDQVQSPLDYVIVDEIDSILIDEARTPLIISGPAQDDVTRYKKADVVARELINKQKPYANLEKHIDQINRRIANTEGEYSEAKKSKDSERMAAAEKEMDRAQDELESLQAKLEQATQYYEVEQDRHSAHLTHEGIGAAQELAGVGSFFVGSNMEWPHLMEQALRAHVTYEKEKDYVVQAGEVVIVDSFTGRLMVGRQWSDGLHQAVEAKENVTVKQESQTMATITIQNFFKLYQQLAGMTGTAMTESDEFNKIYGLEVVAIPTNRPIVRDDQDDLIFKTIAEKFNAIVDEIHAISKSGRPVLVGTISIEKSEALSAALTRRYGLEHEVLNAKQHAREAAIIVKAGQQYTHRDGNKWGNVTIATNMAGRGMDIKLGSGVREVGGLHVLGTERHEARRIDNQLRGRAGRQGDPGSSQFFLSFDDDLMRIFASDWTVKALSWIGWQEGEPIYHKQISKGVERAQKKVEERNFEARKSLLEYDEVMDYQRQVFYTRRQSILEGRKLEGLIWEMVEDAVNESCQTMLDKLYPYVCVQEWARTTLGVDLDMDRIKGRDAESLEHTILDHARNNAEQEISITLGEYMDDDIPVEEWDLKALSKWAMSKFSVNVSNTQLRKMNFEEVYEQLRDAACVQIDKTDCSRITAFLEDDYPRQTLAGWFNDKLALSVKAENLAEKNPPQVEEFLLEEARTAYRRREIEFPVDHILNVALHRQQAGSGQAARAVCDWVKYKFDVEIDLDEVQNMSFDKLQAHLLKLNRQWNNGKLREYIEPHLSQCDWSENAVAKLTDWANNRFDGKLKPEELTQENAMETIEHLGREFLRNELTQLEKYVLLQIFDVQWKDHLYAMDHLKSGIGLRGFAERDPKMEYKREGYRMFQTMLSTIREKVSDIIFKAQLDSSAQMRSVWNISSTMHAQADHFDAQRQAAQAPQGEVKTPTIKIETPKVGRNDPCPCGSGKKYKKCCGRGQ